MSRTVNGRAVERFMRERLEAVERIQPRCAHFRVCGGCFMQDVPYADQVRAKQAMVETLIREFEGLEAVEIRPVLGMDSPWEYRNKVEMTFGAGHDGVVLGFAPRRKFYALVDVTECPITPRRLIEAAAAVRQFAREHALEPYDTRTHEGLVRNLVIREGRNTGDLLINIVCASANWQREEFAAAMQQFRPSGVTCTLNQQLSNAVKFDALEVLSGSDVVRERILGLLFTLSPQVFFQTNTAMAEVLCRQVAEAAGDGQGRVLDAYCGVGTLSLLVARGWSSVVGVEIVEQAVADATANARRNRLLNVAFVCQAAQDYKWAQGQFELVILDPPRAGCHTRLIRRLLETRPPRLIYVSCNPASLAADLARLQDGYQVQWVQPIDMFPHTLHVESVALLTAKH